MNDAVKKIGIVTLNGYFNFGNRLQAYALQEVVKELGFVAHTIVPIKNNISDQKSESVAQKISRISSLHMRDILKRMSKKIQKIIFYRTIKKRTKKLKDFSKTFLSEVFYDASLESLKAADDIYDYFITGSDQVWNPYGITGIEHAFFLAFAEPKKRISYAASFGIEHLPNHYKEMITPWLSSMRAISVREESGAEIVKNTSGREATISLDPTLLLSKEKWLDIATRGRKDNGKFILLYFLGEKTAETMLLVKEASKKFNLDIVDLNNPRDSQVYGIGPLEFINYIYSAEAVFTDSFHGTAFSILMETPFVVTERTGDLSMYSRIETLLKSLDLYCRKSHKIRELNNIFDVDFTHTRSLLESKRIASRQYLKEALSVKV